MENENWSSAQVSAVVGIGFAVIAIIVFFPMAIIWALNTLFFNESRGQVAIMYDFWSWLSILLICGIFSKPCFHNTLQK